MPLRVGLVARAVGFRHAIPRAVAEHVVRLHREVELAVISTALDPELRPLVEWWRVAAPAGPGPRQDAVFAAGAARAIRQVGADLVQTCGVLLPSRVDIAWLHFSHLLFQDATGLRGGARGLRAAAACAAERWCLSRRTRLLVAPSAQAARRIESLLPEAAVAVCPNGVDAARFRPDAAVRAAVRRELRAGEGELVVVCVAQRRASKRPDVAVAAAAVASGAGQPVRLWILGDNPPEPLLERARALGIAGRVEVLGFRTDVERYYQAADAFVLPSLNETFSLAALEAAATGLPLVAPRVGVAAELLRDGEAGIAAELEPGAMGAALARLAADAPLRARLGAAARARAAAYTWERSAQAMLGLYRELAAAG